MNKQRNQHQQNLQKFRRSLGQIWRNLSIFMIDKSNFGYWQSSNNAADRAYNQKIRFYAYLPPLEEQKDWLEKIYWKNSN